LELGFSLGSRIQRTRFIFIGASLSAVFIDSEDIADKNVGLQNCYFKAAFVQRERPTKVALTQIKMA